MLVIIILYSFFFSYFVCYLLFTRDILLFFLWKAYCSKGFLDHILLCLPLGWGHPCIIQLLLYLMACCSNHKACREVQQLRGIFRINITGRNRAPKLQQMKTLRYFFIVSNSFVTMYMFKLLVVSYGHFFGFALYKKHYVPSGFPLLYFTFSGQ